MPTLADPPVVLRQCNGCAAALRPATANEVAAHRTGAALPDARRDCPGCAPHATRDDLAVLAAAHIAVRTGSVVDWPLGDVEAALAVASDLTAALRAVLDIRGEVSR